MTKDNNKEYKTLTSEDVKIIKTDPSLADYIVRNKTKSNRKNTVIIALIVMCLSFSAGVFIGMRCVKTYMPNNVVQVQVGDGASKQEQPTQESK